MSQVVNDHASKIETITGIFKILKNKNDEQDDRFRTIGERDTELKDKLKLLEAQITATNTVIEDNDTTIKGKLQILESVIEKNDTTIKDKLQTLESQLQSTKKTHSTKQQAFTTCPNSLE